MCVQQFQYQSLSPRPTSLICALILQQYPDLTVSLPSQHPPLFSFSAVSLRSQRTEQPLWEGMLAQPCSDRHFNPVQNHLFHPGDADCLTPASHHCLFQFEVFRQHETVLSPLPPPCRGSLALVRAGRQAAAARSGIYSSERCLSAGGEGYQS